MVPALLEPQTRITLAWRWCSNVQPTASLSFLVSRCLKRLIPFFVSDFKGRLYQWDDPQWTVDWLLSAQLLTLDKIRLVIRLAWQYCPQLRCPRQAAVSISKNNHNLFGKSISIRKRLSHYSTFFLTTFFSLDC